MARDMLGQPRPLSGGITHRSRHDAVMRRDPTWAQLSTARAFQDEFDLHFPLISAAAEMIPFADASFDLVISEYGASIWSDPYRWIPEAARVLRPGGALIFLVNDTLLKVWKALKK